MSRSQGRFTYSRKAALAALRLAGTALVVPAVTGCSTYKPPQVSYDSPAEMKPAVLQVDVPKPVEVVALAQPLPLPGQLKPLPAALPIAQMEPLDPKARIAQANAAARMQPTRADYVNAVQVYPYSVGALYQLYTSPGEVTDIALEEGEHLVGAGPVAAGDTVRWIIGDTESGSGPTRRVHILIKPTRKDLATNLVINTDRRTYHLELRSTDRTYMASVSWQYPADQLIAVHREAVAAEATAPVDAGVDVSHLRFRYRIEGDRPAWRPLSAFDDEHKVYIEMPPGLAEGEAPPLFVVGADGKGDLVNYRVHDNYYIVDRLFGAAELRLGGKHQETVRIVRTDERRAAS